MSVSTPHAEYVHHQLIWRRIRDVAEGRDALLQQARVFTRTRTRGSLFAANGLQEEYIQRLSNQSDLDYLSYCERAAFFNATGRTVDALAGMVMAKPPHEAMPAPLDVYAQDITLDGMNLREFVQQVVYEELTTTRVGVLVDYPRNVPSGLSRGEAERLNIRPFVKMYKAESILNWRVGVVNGQKMVTMVILSETVDVAKSEFTTEQVTQYRVLDLTPEGYRVRIMTDSDDVLDEFFPLMNGSPMGFIPFTVVGSIEVRKPLLIDLVDTNIAHYRNSADYERGLHFTGLPTPYISGVQLPEGATLQIGSLAAWVFPDPAAKAAFLEFDGAGLSELREAMRDKERRMAVLGARMLQDEKRTAEASSTLEQRTAGERSILAAVAYDVSDAMRKALNWMAQWSGVATEAEFDLNVDFGAQRMQPQMLTALMSAVQSDLMPMSVFFDNIKQGELVRPDVDFEQYAAELEATAPSFDIVSEQQEPQSLVTSLRQRLGL